MSAWFERLVGPEYATPAMWIVSGLLLAILLLVLVRLLRGFASGTFVAGGRNRRARLAVMDAAAVDSRRRLVLVRRDDVEHLILIGGPTDLVVEQDIRMVTPGRRQTDMEPEAPASQPPVPAPAKPKEPSVEAPRPRLVSPPPPPPAAPVKPPERAFPAAPARDGIYPARPAATVTPVPPAPRPAPAVAIETPTPAAPAERIPEPRVEPVAPQSYEYPQPAEPRPQPAPEASVVTPLPATSEPAAPSVPSPTAGDEALLRELEVTLDTTNRKQADAGPDDISLEEEMSKLLGDLSGDRR